jgi:hypothetical protein
MPRQKVEAGSRRGAFTDSTKVLHLYFGHCVQGEDVSMGIWMAAIGPRRHQVSKLQGAGLGAHGCTGYEASTQRASN